MGATAGGDGCGRATGAHPVGTVLGCRPWSCSAPTRCGRRSSRSATRCRPHAADDQPAQRLPGAGRRHRHEHGPHARCRGRVELRQAAPELEATCAAISHGSLMGARGNSGVILSQILRGLAGTLRADRRRRRVAEALARARRPRRTRRCCADRGDDPDGGARVGRGGGGPPRVMSPRVLHAARAAGGAALANTPELLPGVEGRRRRRCRWRRVPAVARRGAPRRRRRCRCRSPTSVRRLDSLDIAAPVTTPATSPTCATR